MKFGLNLLKIGAQNTTAPAPITANILVRNPNTNKCIGDDTKAVTRQSPNCIEKQKNKNKIWRKTICNVACGSGIMTVNSPSASTLQCDTSLWDDMPLNSPGGRTLQCDTWLWDHDNNRFFEKPMYDFP